jgi:transcriptional regulator with PAS, ATPase and Fis domain
MNTHPFLVAISTDGRVLHQDAPLGPGVEAALRASGAVRRLWTFDQADRTWSILSIPSDRAVLHMLWSGGAEDPLADFAGSVDFAHDILSHFLTNPFEAITVVDAEGRLRWVSPVHARFFGIKRGEGLGQPADQVIENTRLPEVARTGRAEVGQVQNMRGVDRVVSRFPIKRGDKVLGAIGQVMFKGPEQAAAFGREIARLRAEVDHYKRELEALRGRPDPLDAMIGDSPAITKLKSDIARVAPLDVPVLIRGESGTGKELVAHALHGLSDRGDGPLVMLNAAALPETLVESELFGTEPGAFTGAQAKGRPGKLEAAHGGTFFLDEIGDMSAETQAKMLRVLDEGRFERLGGTETRDADFRLVTATNRPLEKLIAEDRFRADLYFRIGVVTLITPPLRDRLEDIPAIARAILTRTADRHGLGVREIRADALGVLTRHSWPGNVRELINVIQKAAIFAEGSELTAADLSDLAPAQSSGSRAPLKRRLESVEEGLIRQALETSRGNKKRAAELLGISRGYLYKRLAEMG